MLKISEHFEFYNSDHFSAFQKLNKWKSYFDLEVLQDEINFDGDEKKNCISIELKRNIEDDKNSCTISSSYFIGLDRFKNLGCTVYIEPKLNNENVQLNYIAMLLEALKEPDNFDHLEGLFTARFNDDWIEIENQLQPLLTPFLVAQFLSVVKLLVKKGLKKSYYEKVENLNNKIKGKVLVGQQIKQNILKNRFTKTVCKYQDFGFDTESNQFLKFILSIVPNVLESFRHDNNFTELQEVLNYCKGGFYRVSDNKFKKLKYKENNPFYKDYNLAITLGNQILSLLDYNISNNKAKEKIMHPPFWIDMSKLFELYVYKELKKQFPEEGQVKYHEKHNRQELDFIINAGSFKAVVDAKYKPRYKAGNPSMEDARQLSGYTRLKTVYNKLQISDDQLIPAYFIYPSNLSDSVAKIENEEEDRYKYISKVKDKVLINEINRESTTYKRMYLAEIALPVNN